MPTGNIACDLGGSDAAVVGGVRCDIRDQTWVPPPKPADCELDWGGGLSLADGAATVTCTSDTVFDPY